MPRNLLAAMLCAVTAIATCSAQSNSTFSIVQTSQATTDGGWTPRNVYAVDVNNDGIPDLIEDQYYGPSLQPVFGVSLATGRGDGTFRPTVPYNYPPGILQTPMAFGDFNGDGKVDIAMIGGYQTIAIYLGFGDGTFTNPWYSNVSIGAGQNLSVFTSIVASDFNHDGKTDLAVVGSDVNDTVYVLPGSGNGLFSIAYPILTVTGASGYGAAGEGVQRVLLGDFDSDNNADLAVVASTGNRSGTISSLTVHVLYGDGGFGFSDTTPITSTNYGVVANMNSGDLDGDGLTDLFAINSDNYNLYTFYGQPDRTFSSYTQQLPQAGYMYGEDYLAPMIGIADFNDDGRNDLLTNADVGNSPKIMLLLATPTRGQFEVQSTDVPGGTSVYSAPQAGDFNGDGKPDWILASYNWNPSAGIVYTGLNSTTGTLWSNCNYPYTERGINVCSPAVSSGSEVNFSAAARSFSQIRRMELWVDGQKLGEQHNTWERNAFFNSSASLGAGTHYGAFVTADVDNTLQIANFTFTVPSNCGVPQSAGVQICTPANGSSAPGRNVLVTAASKVPGTLARMEVWVDSTKAYSEFTSNELSASINVSSGSHQITVFAVNSDGLVYGSAKTVAVP